MDEKTTAAPMGDTATVTEPSQQTATGAQTPPDAPEATTGDFMTNPAVLAYIDAKVAEGVAKALQGKPPKANTADPSAAEKARFDKMGYKERLKLFMSDPHTYQKLKGSN